MTQQKWSLAIHGGAGILRRGEVSPETDAAVRAALTLALERASALLATGGSAMDAVTTAVSLLEDDPHFNAGRGAVFTFEGTQELDAAIMDGAGRNAGAIARAHATRNPILLARKVMEESPHVMLSGEGADRFSLEQGLDQAGAEWFATPERRAQWEEMSSQTSDWFDADMKYGTVGAVALDQAGNVAGGTSTGGITGKRWGRIGDSPVIGAGTYADNRACAVSATGAGEYFIRLGVAHEICARMRFAGEDAGAAASHVIGELTAMGGTGGVIFVAPDGSAGWRFNSPGMFRGKAMSDGERCVAIYGDEG